MRNRATGTIEYRHLPVSDDGNPKPAEWFHAGVEFSKQAYRARGRLLVCCMAGLHRAPSMVYAILVAACRADPILARATIMVRRLGAEIIYQRLMADQAHKRNDNCCDREDDDSALKDGVCDRLTQLSRS
jgi:protein-tyrosine phosphatase